MKKSILLLLTVGLVFAACNKESMQPSNAEITGKVLYGGDRAADGIGYYILTDNDHAALSPQNLPAEFKHTNVDQHVAIRYFDTGATLHMEQVPGAAGPKIVVLKSIRPL
jgi:hypothetical protein